MHSTTLSHRFFLPAKQSLFVLCVCASLFVATGAIQLTQASSPILQELRAPELAGRPSKVPTIIGPGGMTWAG
jgi:hypothetical protein